jgi:WD40 repeat protein
MSRSAPKSLAYSPAGVLAAAVVRLANPGEVTLFDSGKGTLIKVLGTTTDMMLDVKFSPDGTRLAVCWRGQRDPRLRHRHGQEQLRIEQHADWVMAVDFSRDGTQLASASRDKTARIFDSKTGELEATYVGHTAAIFSVFFNNDGKTVCSVGRDKKIHFWEPKDAKAKAESAASTAKYSKSLSPAIISSLVLRIKMSGSIPSRSGNWCAHFRATETGSIRSRSTLKSTARQRWLRREIRIWNIADGQLVTAFTAAPGYLTAEKKN